MRPDETRPALKLITDAAVSAGLSVLKTMAGAPNARRAGLLEHIPPVVAHYSEGTAALAADYYEEERLRAGERSQFVATLVVEDRTTKLRNGIAWAADPLFGDEPDEALAGVRLAEVIQLDTARPFRSTIAQNARRDPQAVGWKRVTSATACGLCRMLANRGAIYRHDTVRFAAHTNCYCTMQAVFGKNDYGPEASALQYAANGGRVRTAEQKRRLREAIAAYS